MTTWLLPINCVIIAVLTLVLAWSGQAVFVHAQHQVYAENGPLENLQALLLLMSALAFATRASINQNPERLILCFCALLCVSFILRELDVERLSVPETMKLIGAGNGRNVLLGSAFLTLIAIATRRFSIYKSASLAFLQSTTGALLIIASSLLLLGGAFEELKAITHSTWFEESCELLGYGFILMASFGTGLTSRFARQRQA